MFKVYYFLIILTKYRFPICNVLPIRSSEFISKSSYFSSLILKAPDEISLLPSEFDFIMLLSRRNLGKCSSILLLIAILSISTGIFLFIVIFSKDSYAFVAVRSSNNSVIIKLPSCFFKLNGF